MSTIIDQIRQSSSYRVFYNEKPAAGPRVLPLNLDFSSISSIAINLKLSFDMNVIEYVQGIFIDNSSNTAQFTIQSSISKQLLAVPAGCQALLPFFAPNAPDFTAISTGGVIVPVQFLTFAVQPCVWSASATGGGGGGAVTLTPFAATDGSTTITTGGTAQTLFGGTAPTNGYAVYNPDPTNDLWISDSTTAAANGTGSIRVPANGGWFETPLTYKPLGAVSIEGAVSGQKITARRW